MKLRGKTRYYTKYSAEYHVFPATFHVLSRKVGYLWDSAPPGIIFSTKASGLMFNQYNDNRGVLAS